MYRPRPPAMDFVTKLKLYCAFLVFVSGAAAQDSACYQTKMACLPDMDADVSTFCSESNINTVRSCIDNADCTGDLLSDNIVEGHFRKMVEKCQEPICLESMRGCFPASQAKFSRMKSLDDTELSSFCAELISATGCLANVQSKCQSVSLGALQSVAMELTSPAVFVATYCSMQTQFCALTALQCLPDSFLTMETSNKTIEGSCQNAPSVKTCIDNTVCNGLAQESFRTLVKDKYEEHCSILPITSARKCFGSIATDVVDAKSAACSLADAASCVGDAKLNWATDAQKAQVQAVEDSLVTDCVPQCDKDGLKACVDSICDIQKGIRKINLKKWLERVDSDESDESDEDASSTKKRRRSRFRRGYRKLRNVLCCMRDRLVGCEPDEVQDILPRAWFGIKRANFHFCARTESP